MEVARRVNCTTATVDGMIDCLRNTSALAIAQNMRITVFPCLMFTWTPLLEEDFGQERFVREDPSVLFRSGNFSRVNAIMGITDHEFISPAAVLVSVLIQGLLVTLTIGQVIQIEDGLILGREMESRSGVTFNAFLGIPFARPPIGELRFRAPVRNKPWDGILNCTENIHHFGGDRNRVTIGGHSAGSFSVTAHMASPMSQGLFHRVIGLSGSITSGPVDAPIRRGTSNSAAAIELAKRVNCTIVSVDGMVECLRNTSAEVIAQNMRIEVFPCLVLAWTPLIEEDFGQERFLTDDPSVLFRQGNFSRVSTIAGITDHEFIAPAAIHQTQHRIIILHSKKQLSDAHGLFETKRSGMK
ncbi:hypothetical protein HA402_008793 [Bradysia odoriphaga]|nr:hypothetical protein HA402_008793 [Bradysia odoriphaga]